MDIEVRKEQQFTVAVVRGRLDASNAQQFEKQCNTWIDEGSQNLALDFSGLDYISSAGLRAILASAKRLRKTGGTVVLCGLSGLVREVVSVSGFDSFLPVYETVEQALNGGK